MKFEEIYAHMAAEYKTLAGAEPEDAADVSIRLKVLAGELYTVLCAAESLKLNCFPQTAAGEAGKVVRIMPFGAFVELKPKKDGMIHISRLSDKRVEKVEDVVNIGDMVTVKVLDVDKMGKISLSMKPGDLAKKESEN